MREASRNIPGCLSHFRAAPDHPALRPLFIAYDQNLRRLPKADGIGNKQFQHDLVGIRHQLVRLFGMRRHDRNLFLPDRHLRQQPRIGLGKTGQIIGLIDRQRTPDETLLVDDLRLRPARSARPPARSGSPPRRPSW